MKKIEISDLLNFRFPSAPAFSPDGKLAAFVVQTSSLEKNKYLGDIWLLDVQTGEMTLLAKLNAYVGYHNVGTDARLGGGTGIKAAAL